MRHAPEHQPSSPERRSIAANGARLACSLSGPDDAPVILFVHGYPDNHRVWDRVVAALEPDFRCVRFDVRGAGMSEAPTAVDDYRLERLQSDIASIIDTVSPNGPVHLVGHDWGSIQGWDAATEPRLSHRIASFTSISGPCLDHAGFWLRRQWHRAPVKLLSQLRRSWYIAMFHLPVGPALAWRTLLGDRWPAITARFEGESRPVNAHQAADGATGMKLYRANILRRLRAPRERVARMPVQVITPLRDPFVGPDFVDGLDRWVHDLTITEIDAGHWAIETRPVEVAAAIRAHIERAVVQPKNGMTGDTPNTASKSAPRPAVARAS